jgi:hypothetical protein
LQKGAAVFSATTAPWINPTVFYRGTCCGFGKTFGLIGKMPGTLVSGRQFGGVPVVPAGQRQLGGVPTDPGGQAC